jgi:hypothetical protein
VLIESSTKGDEEDEEEVTEDGQDVSVKEVALLGNECCDSIQRHAIKQHQK